MTLCEMDWFHIVHETNSANVCIHDTDRTFTDVYIKIQQITELRMHATRKEMKQLHAGSCVIMLETAEISR